MARGKQEKGSVYLMDDLDRAQILEEKEREAALLRRKPTLKAVGFCHNCGEWVHPGQLFCSVECRDDHDREQEARKRNGG
jgi:hypothetical protein